jgi:hypothetical protein
LEGVVRKVRVGVFGYWTFVDLVALRWMWWACGSEATHFGSPNTYRNVYRRAGRVGSVPWNYYSFQYPSTRRCYLLRML